MTASGAPGARGQTLLRLPGDSPSLHHSGLLSLSSAVLGAASAIPATVDGPRYGKNRGDGVEGPVHLPPDGGQTVLSKRFAILGTALGVALALAIAVLALTPHEAAAQGPQGTNASQACKAAQNRVNLLRGTTALTGLQNVAVTHGACVALITAGNPVPLYASLCRTANRTQLAQALALTPAQQQQLAQANHGQCMQILKATNLRGALPTLPTGTP